MDRLNDMLDNAIQGNPVENSFDETKMSALEVKMSKLLAMNYTAKAQLQKEKLQFNELISDISHQIKTPLANIILYSQLLEESNLVESENELIKELVSQTEILNFLITSLIKASLLEAGVIIVNPKANSIYPILNRILSQYSPKAECKNITITCMPTEVIALCDAKWLGEALGNILDNSIKYTPSGGQVTISVTAYQLFCRVDITDNGIGVCEAEHAKIFARFYRSSTVSDEEGLGIGLYLAREIIASQGGYIKVKSMLKKGSTFSVFLPLKQ